MALVCEGCKASNPTQQCPTCKKLGLPPSFFCTQDCFKKHWGQHKEKHSQPPPASISTMTDVDLMTFNFTGPLRPYKITPKRVVPPAIARPDYADNADGRSPSEERDRSNRVPKWAGEDVTKMRHVCKLSREVVDLAVAAAKPGVTTDEIDRIVHEATVERGMYPSPLNYYNFPKSCCTSVNEIICHGIPDSRPLEPGDILNIDVSSFLGGFHADLNETIFIGRPDADSVRVVHCAFECLNAGIATLAPGSLYKQIGDAIEQVANSYECSVVRTYTGHGVGDKFHTAPNIPHYGNNKCPGVVAAGHIFTIEPMINLGTWADVTWPDRWTSATKDGKRSAQFEHTIYINEEGKPELLTDWTDGVPWYQKQLSALHISLPIPTLTSAESPAPSS